MRTLYLDGGTWDLALDSNGSIAVATDAYRMAQDAASAIRTFLGECYYDTTRGVPHFEQILGHRPPLELVRQLLVTAALTQAGIASAKVFLTAITPTMTGEVQVSDAAGNTAAAGF
jgi:hypothetical protein